MYYLCCTQALKMKYFLRYTSDANLDLARKTSLHQADEETEGAEYFDDIEGYGVLLDGICAYEIEAEDEEEALEEAVELVLYNRANYSPNAAEFEDRKAYLFEGEVCGDCWDGVLIDPVRIISNISELADNE